MILSTRLWDNNSLINANAAKLSRLLISCYNQLPFCKYMYGDDTSKNKMRIKQSIFFLQENKPIHISTVAWRSANFRVKTFMNCCGRANEWCLIPIHNRRRSLATIMTRFFVSWHRCPVIPLDKWWEKQCTHMANILHLYTNLWNKIWYWELL